MAVDEDFFTTVVDAEKEGLSGDGNPSVGNAVEQCGESLRSTVFWSRVTVASPSRNIYGEQKQGCTVSSLQLQPLPRLHEFVS